MGHRWVGLAAIVLALGMLGSIVGAIAAGAPNILTSLLYVVADPWGVVTLVDLVVGFVLAGVWIGATERNRFGAAAWIAGIMLLGNVVTAAFVAVRAFGSGSFAEMMLGRHHVAEPAS